MAIAEMSKLNLAAMNYDRDCILNALQRTRAAEIKLHYDAENTDAMAADTENLRDYLDKTEGALSLLVSEADAYNKENKVKSDDLKDGFDVSYTQFTAAKDMRAEMDSLVNTINGLNLRKKELLSELNKTVKLKEEALIYSAVDSPLEDFTDTRRVKIKLGTVPLPLADNFSAACAATPLIQCEMLGSDAENALFVFAAHKSVSGTAEGILQESGFVPCPFSGSRSSKEVYDDILCSEEKIKADLKENSEKM